MGASSPAATRPKWSSTTARMPLSTQRRVSSAPILCSLSPTCSGVSGTASSSGAASAGASGVSVGAGAAVSGLASVPASASAAVTSMGAVSSIPTSGRLMLSSMPGAVSRVGAAGAFSSSPTPKKRKGFVGSSGSALGAAGAVAAAFSARATSSAKTIFGSGGWAAFSSSSSASVSTPSTSCGAFFTSIGFSALAGGVSGKSRALSSCISLCSFCSCGVSGPRT